jgi:capsular exopolysaccharide synthesis family protein
MIHEDNQPIISEEKFPFDKYWRIIKPKLHIVIFITLFMVIGAWIKESLKTPMYNATGLLMIEPEREVINFGNTYRFYGYRNEYFNTQIKILNSRSLNKAVMEEMVLYGVDFSKVSIGGMSVSPIEDTRLVYISYMASDAEVAAKLVNTLFEKIIEFNVNIKTKSSKQATEFISKQIKNLRINLAQKEGELQEYGKRKGLFYLSRKDSTVVEKFSDLNKAYTNIQIDRVNKQAAYEELKGRSFEDYPQVKQSQLISNLKSNYSNLESDYKKKSQIFKESYPAMKQIKSQMDTLKERIQYETRDIAMKIFKEAKNDYQSALKKEKSLLALLNEQKGVMVGSNADAIYYNSLNIEVENMRVLLNYLGKRQKESLLSSKTEQSGISNIRVIDKAEIPYSPVSSGKRKTLIMAFILGISIGLGLIFLADYLDRTIKMPEDVRALLGVPALGVVFSSKDKSYKSLYYYDDYKYGKKKDSKKKFEPKDIELINFIDPECRFSESYRSIRTSILLSSAEHAPRIITITSAVPQEGKTATTANLAISFCQLGKKVLILDGDMRKPRMHKIFNKKNTIGLSSYLVGRVKFSQIIQTTHIPNLFLVPSGPIPPNPAELIDSEIMKNMLKKLLDIVDFVFIDSPPLIGIVDTIILGKHSDGVVLVNWAGKTKNELIEKAKIELDQFNIRTLGVVLNKVDFKKTSSDMYNYSYQYSYRYREDEEVNG